MIGRKLAERAYYQVCLALGWLLRSVRYSQVQVVSQDGELQVRKRRVFVAPLLIWMSNPLIKTLDTGVRILPQREWEERERRIYWRLRAATVRIDADGMLVLPCLTGKTLATLLDDRELPEPVRNTAIERAVVALAEFHQFGFTHGDAMAENVLVDLAPRRRAGRPEHSSPLDSVRGDPEGLEGSKGEGGLANWFDFETSHEATRHAAWQRADDVRALLVTCLVRTIPEKRAETLQLILDTYADEGVTRVLAASFTSVFRRSLAFHLAQAGLSFHGFLDIAALLRERVDK